MAITLLDAPVNVSSTNIVPAISAGTNRLVKITVCMYNGAGSVTPPTTLTVNSISGLFESGDNAAQTRVSSTSFIFFEADIAAIVGGTIVTGGQSGTVKSVTVMSIQGVAQSLPTATNKAYATSSSTLNLSLTRAASSFTILIGYTSTTSQAMNMTNPSRDTFISFSPGTISYGYEADTAQTINSTVAGSNHTTAHVVNYVEAPTQTIVSVNDGNPVIYGTAFNWVTSGFSPAPNSATIAGISCSSVSGSGATPPALVDNTVIYNPGTRQIIASNGTQSANLNISTTVASGYAAQQLVGDPYLGAGSVVVEFDPPAKDTDYIIYPTADDTTVDDKGRIETNHDDPDTPMVFVHLSTINSDTSNCYTYYVYTGTAPNGEPVYTVARAVGCAIAVSIINFIY